MKIFVNFDHRSRDIMPGNRSLFFLLDDTIKQQEMHVPAHGRPGYSNMVADFMAGYAGMVEDGLYDFPVTDMVEMHHHRPLFVREFTRVLKIAGRVLAFI